MKAWQTGAKEWRENVSEELTGFFEMHSAWELYEPVGFPGTVQIDLPDRTDIVATYEERLEDFIEREMGPQLARIQNELSKSQNSIKWLNKLGVLYARYGLDEKALTEFKKILNRRDYLPALLNIGNLYYIREELTEARNYYLKAQEQSPNNAKVLLAVARVDHDLENYGTAKAAYKQLQEIDPGLAARFSYLDLRGNEAQRAADIAQVKGVVLWEEE
jgi:tetratricopeptide (TPR) repeat protein